MIIARNGGLTFFFLVVGDTGNNFENLWNVACSDDL